MTLGMLAYRATHQDVEGALGVELAGDHVVIPVHALSGGSRCQSRRRRDATDRAGAQRGSSGETTDRTIDPLFVI